MTDRERLWRETEGNDTLKAAEELAKQLQRSGSAVDARRFVRSANENIERWARLVEDVRTIAFPREPNAEGWVYVWDLFPQDHNDTIAPHSMRLVIQGEDFWDKAGKWDEYLAFTYNDDIKERRDFDDKMNVQRGVDTGRIYIVAAANKKGEGFASSKEYVNVVTSRMRRSLRGDSTAEEIINQKILCDVVATIPHVFDHPYHA